MRNLPRWNTTPPASIRHASPKASDTGIDTHVERFIQISEGDGAAIDAHIKYSAEMSEILLQLYPEINKKNPALAARIWSLTQESGFALHVAFLNIREKLGRARVSVDQRMAEEDKSSPRGERE